MYPGERNTFHDNVVIVDLTTKIILNKKEQTAKT